MKKFMDYKVQELKKQMEKFKAENQKLKKLKLTYEDVVRHKLKLEKEFSEEQRD